MDKGRVARCFARALGTYDGDAFVQRAVAERMARLLGACPGLPLGGRIFEFGCGTGFYSQLLFQRFRPACFWMNDPCPEAEGQCFRRLAQGFPEKGAGLPGESGGDFWDKGLRFLAGDVEEMELSGGWDLITSCSTLQWLGRPARFLARCRDALRVGGTLGVSTYGPETLREIRLLAGAGLDYRSLMEWEAMLESAGLRVVHAEGEMLSCTFLSPRGVLRHLKNTGVTGVPAQGRPWTPGRLRRFTEEYRRRFPAPGPGRGGELPVVLTYQPLYLVARRVD